MLSSMFSSRLVVLFIVSCGALEFNSTAQVDEYFDNLHKDSQLISLDEVFEVSSRHICSVDLRILLSGNVSLITCLGTNCKIRTIAKKGSRKEFKLARLRNGEERLFLKWYNSSHHTRYNDILPLFEFENVLARKRYHAGSGHLHRDFFDVDITWINRFPKLGTYDSPFLGGGNDYTEITCISKGKGVCHFTKPCRIQIKKLEARNAVNRENFTVELMVDETVASKHKRCFFNLPPVRFSVTDCPDSSKYCRPRCKPGNVVNATYDFTNDTLVIGWLPPPGSEDVVSYVLRWGFLPVHSKGSELVFPLDDSHSYRYLNLKPNQTELSINISGIDSHTVRKRHFAVQIVGLCVEKALSLKKAFSLEKDLGQEIMFNSSNMLKEFFQPARIDVLIAPDNPQDSEGHAGSKEELRSSSRHPGNSQDARQDLAEILVPIAAVSALALIVILAVLVRSKRYERQKHRHHKNAHLLKSNMQNNPLYHSLYVNTAEADRWEIAPDSIEWGEEIGYGAFGCVFKCSLLNEKFVNQECITVAVKTLAGDSDELSRQQFIQEILVMKELENHPNILQLIGCVTTKEPECLIMEYAYNGDLLSYLQSLRANTMESNINESGNMAIMEDTISYARQLQMAVDIAVGMEYISAKGYVHRDLAARNLLLDSYLNVKIADFGLTRYLHSEDVYVVQNSKRLPVKWLSIEALADLTFSMASDIWAFGVVLFELFSLGETPYPTIDPIDMLKHLVSGQRMEKPSRCVQPVYDMMMDCWQAKPSSRPNFTVLRQCLIDLYTDHTNYGNMDTMSIYSTNSISDNNSDVNGFDSDEGFVPASPHQTRSSLPSESSNFSDVSMIVTSPEFERKCLSGETGEEDDAISLQSQDAKKISAKENDETADRVYEVFHYQM